MASLPLLSANEARVLGVMIEKQRTVPDTYPLSLNALTAGCNQKNSRDPVLNLTEAEVAEGLLGLRSHSLVIETTGSRVSRYGHNLERVLGIPAQSAALLAILMLRGPQTVGELRINCERLHRFADISAVEGFLNEMAERADGKLVVELPRQPGARENRWAHLLCGEVDIAALQEEAAPASRISSQTEARFAALEAEVARLREMVEKLSAALGG